MLARLRPRVNRPGLYEIDGPTGLRCLQYSQFDRFDTSSDRAVTSAYTVSVVVDNPQLAGP